VEEIDIPALPRHRGSVTVAEDAMIIVPVGLHLLAATEGTGLLTITMVVVEVDLGPLTIEIQDTETVAVMM
jgi:hypothetical protein